MTAEPREELISAYLDGELAEPERAEVEKLLAENSSLRQLHDELRALRSGMQSLERHRVERDLSGAVLRRAEQSVLRGSSAHGKVVPASRTWWNRSSGWRPLIWPAVAVAAALAILLYDANQRPAERQIAQTPHRQEELRYADGASEPTNSAAPQAGIVATPTDSFQLRTEEAAGASADVKGVEMELLRRSAELQKVRGRTLARPQAMPAQDAASPAPSPAASEPASDVMRFAPNKQLSSSSLFAQIGQNENGIVVPVTPAYLRAGTFEKLLTERKIKWQRVAPDPSRPIDAYYRTLEAKENEARDETGKAQALQATYTLEAESGPVEKLLTELEQRTFGLALAKKSGEELSEDLSARRKLVESLKGRVTIILVAPRVAPAAPAESKP